MKNIARAVCLACVLSSCAIVPVAAAQDRTVVVDRCAPARPLEKREIADYSRRESASVDLKSFVGGRDEILICETCAATVLLVLFILILL